jgi:uncharacterized protein with NRDE domain
LKALGTWLGLSGRPLPNDDEALMNATTNKDDHWTDLRLAVVTNFREPHYSSPHTKSRGHLVTSCLLHPEAHHDFIDRLPLHEYDGFNLLAMDLMQRPIVAAYKSNRYEAARKQVTSSLTLVSRLPTTGVHGLSNSVYGVMWPKIEHGKTLFRNALEQHRLASESVLLDSLFRVLRDEQRFEDEHALPRTGMPLDVERMLSSICVSSDNYGTRTSTVVLVTDEGTLFVERDLKSGQDQRFFVRQGNKL